MQKTVIGKIKSSQFWLLIFISGGVFVALSLRYLDSPGLYMDAVNPDYLASWLSSKSGTQPAWLFPDNYLFGTYKYPLLNSLYGGNLLGYLAAVFFKLFGYGVYSIRLYHASLGLFLVLSFLYFLKKTNASILLCAFGVVALACDPGFVQAWRTQYYLQLFPLIFFFFGMGLYFDQSVNLISKKKCFISGLFVGIAAWNYFIFIIYGFAFVLFSFFFDSRKRKQEIFPLYILLGFFLGVFPYLYAHISLLLNAGYHGYIEMLRSLQTSYGVVNTSQSLVERFSYVIQRVTGVVGGDDVRKAVFYGTIPFLSVVSFLRVCILLFLMVICAVVIFRKKNNIHNSPLLFFTFVVLFHLAFGIFVGRPLNTQHYIMLVPILLSICTLGIKDVFCCLPGKAIRNFIAVIAGLFLAATVYAVWTVTSLYKTEAFNKYYSTSINYAIEYTKSEADGAVLLFPQWGYWMPFVTALGPNSVIAEKHSFDELMKDADIENKIKNHQKVILVIGEEMPDSIDRHRSIEIFKRKFQLKDEKIENFKRLSSEAGVLVAVFTSTNVNKNEIQNLKVEGWGPTETTAKVAFNSQTNGKSAIWINVIGFDISKKIEVSIGNFKGEDVIASEKGVTFAVEPKVYEKQGDYPIVLKEIPSGRLVNIGVFKVK